MPIHRIISLLTLVLLLPASHADRISDGSAPLPPPNPYKKQKDKAAEKSLLEMLKRYKAIPSAQDIEEVEEQYQKGYTPLNDEEKKRYDNFAEGQMPFEQTAKECGEKAQRECSPSNLGGRTMCGMAVAKMIQCMGPSTNARPGCTGGCGHGKMFVDCTNGQMKKCGYEKVTPVTSEKCQMAGAVLAYTQSPTKRGAKYGHVEFVCGRGKYCSVYRAPHDRPWPRPTPDACWYPSVGANRK